MAQEKKQPIEELMQHVHPRVHNMVRSSLINVFVNQLAEHARGEAELQEIEDLAKLPEDFGSW